VGDEEVGDARSSDCSSSSRLMTCGLDRHVEGGDRLVGDRSAWG
jgi:hypothetical protein